MFRRLRRLWRHHPIPTVVFSIALIATVFFAQSTIRSAIYWADPEHRDQPLEGWMPPNYVGMSYGLPAKVLQPLLGIDRDAPKQRWTMAEIADRRGLTLDELQAEILRAAEAHRAENR